jgi:ribonuclease BN (tRNA processing enzyme)
LNLTFGDFGPFSSMGKSIGYQITIGGGRYLIDSGAPLFQQIGGHGLKNINGLIVTHCHDDHKRWFTDLALFNMYAQDISERIFLLTSEDVYHELIRASGPALDRSLSEDSQKVIDIAYDQYINYHMIGPRAKYRIVSHDEGKGKTALSVMDNEGNHIGPDRAKIVISEKTKRPRLLFKDPEYKEWVEPESFYPFSSNVFYEENKNIYRGEDGYTMEAIKAPVWHGITAIGVRIKTNEETLVFSSDTVNNKELWEKLYSSKRTHKHKMSKKEFESATIISGDINDFIERTWSKERYNEAINAFQDVMVVHDVAHNYSVVHTDYEQLDKSVLRKNSTILTHSPDLITSEWVLGDTEKTFKIKGNSFFEKDGNNLYPMNADIYHKEPGKYYVGYKNENGQYGIYEQKGLLKISPVDKQYNGKHLYNVDLYEVISGKYFPRLEDENSVYLRRKDGKVELVHFTDEGSNGKVVDCHRESLSKPKETAKQQ